MAQVIYVNFQTRSVKDAVDLFDEAIGWEQRRRLDLAKQLYEASLALDPEFAWCHFRLGCLLWERYGKPTKARVHLRRYLELKPDGEFAAIARRRLQ